MSAALATPTETLDTVDDADFELDMRVVESNTKLVIMMCETSDGCGDTCNTSACASGSNDPF
ncbi:FxLD family lanthipeptide [Lentzea sp. NPDC051213]|uniref:FxLD family lanthipeptide n=1 Tax=Lentzea sp. NPDC051213 TaxID=3364126 RepID=UPI0037BA7EF4